MAKTSEKRKALEEEANELGISFADFLTDESLEAEIKKAKSRKDTKTAVSKNKKGGFKNVY